MRSATKRVSSAFDYSQVTTYVWGQHTAIQVKDTTIQRSARVAPVRPKFSSVANDEENEGGNFGELLDFKSMANPPPKAQASDGVTSSDAEPDAPTAKQINAEVSKQI